MKKFNILIVALVALLGLNSCEQAAVGDNTHAADLVGTWTCLTADFAEALVISADGKVVSTGVANGEYWENVAGTVKAENSHIEMIFEDNDNFEGHFDIIPGAAFSITNLAGEQLTYKYCTEDLADEVVGMWVCSDTPNAQENDMAIITYSADGVSTFTGMIPNAESYMVTTNSSYNVVGDLMFQKSAAEENSTLYLAGRLVYTPKGTSLGDILTKKMYTKVGNTSVETTMSFLRIKQGLDFTGNVQYDYSNIYVTNAKGLNEDFDFGGINLNFSKMDGAVMDKMMKTLLFNVNFPSEDSISYNCRVEDHWVSMEAPIMVDGNKIKIIMSQRNPAYRDIVLYAFQDADNCQMHMYMPTSSFESFFANISVVHLADRGELDLNDKEAVKAVFAGVENAIESINVSLIFKSKSRAL